MGIVKMHRVLLAVALLLVLPGLSSCELEVFNKDAVFLTVVADQSMRIGRGIFLKLIVTNKSAKTFTLIATHPARDYDVLVKDESGNILPLSAYGRQLRDPEALGRNVVALAPGSKYDETLDIGRIFEWNKPGIYLIKVQRKYYDDLKTSPYAITDNKYRVLKSNELKINLLAQDPSR